MTFRLAPPLSEVRADARRAFANKLPCKPPYPASWRLRCEVWVEEYRGEEAAAASKMTCGEPCAFDGQPCGLDPGHLGECLSKRGGVALTPCGVAVYHPGVVNEPREDRHDRDTR